MSAAIAPAMRAALAGTVAAGLRAAQARAIETTASPAVGHR
jgi:hypothetical protein